jgi:hypothetical protein
VGPRGPGPLGRNPKTVETTLDRKQPPTNLSVRMNQSSQEMLISWEHSCPFVKDRDLVDYVVRLIFCLKPGTVY